MQYRFALQRRALRPPATAALILNTRPAVKRSASGGRRYQRFIAAARPDALLCPLERRLHRFEVMVLDAARDGIVDDVVRA